eukprot:COSAG02_NODE_25737_length_650_cov_1.221416_1_plen_39_part_10
MAFWPVSRVAPAGHTIAKSNILPFEGAKPVVGRKLITQK